MLKSRKIKNIISFIFAIVLCVSIVSFPVYADSLSQRFAAWVGAAITAANIALTPIGASAAQMYDYIADPIDYQYTYVDAALDDYFEKSLIIVTPDSVTIDGVRYSDVWLSKDAADIFRTNAFDFKTAYNITSNSNGTFASGAGTGDGVPYFNVDGVIRSQSYIFPSAGLYDVGDGTVNVVQYSSRSRSGEWHNSLFSRSIWSGYGNEYFPISWFTTVTSDGHILSEARPVNYPQYPDYKDFGVWANYFTPHNFSFDWVSGTIDADPLEPDDGLMIRVPSAPINPSTGTPYYDIPQLVTDNPIIDNDNHSINIELDPTLNPEFQKDKDLLDDLGDLIRTILNVWDLLKDDDNTTIEYNKYEQPVPPEPEPPIPEPGTTIADTDYSVLDNLLRWIKRAIDSVKTYVNSFKSTVEDLFNSLFDILEYIKDVLQDILQSLSDLPQTILEDIEKGPIRIFDKAIDALKNIFAPIIAFIKLHLGIWHYVVEWISSIIGVFTFFFNLMSSTSYNLVLPIYALVAGTICIAVYKHFGR